MIALLVAIVALIVAVIGNAIIDPSGDAGGKQRDAASGQMPDRR
jgi:hypothetical protein